GEGQIFLGFKDVTTNGSGNVTFSQSFPQIGAGQRVTTTATDPNGNTSEFSGAIGQLLNVSTRMEVLTGGSVLIGGFIIGGRGNNQTTGIGLVEAYDLDEASTITLTNISTRGFVDTDQNVMIGGFISGDGIVRVIVRALGPTLTQFGVSNVLADPVLDVRDAQG